jgi:indolepyruvate ferredoxin oxidoreductase, beta subunit
MTRSPSFNIIVAGLGGQGVNTLARAIFELSEAHGRPCSGAIFKGGAQKAGTIYSEIRLWPAGHEHVHCSNRILRGSLDLMLGLEPHEALRFSDTFSEDTQFVINDAPIPFYSERAGVRVKNPVQALRQRFRHVVALNFSEIARVDQGDARMANFLMLAEAARSECFPFSREQVDKAIGRWRIASVSPGSA